MWAVRPARLAASACLAGVAVACGLSAAQIRVAEAQASRPLLALVLGRAVHVPGSDLVFYPDHGRETLRALQVTALCSAAPLVIVLLLIGSLAVLVDRFAPVRAIAVVVAGGIVLLAANLVRIVIIAVAMRWWGVDGFAITHRVVGPVVVIGSMTAALVLASRVLAHVSPRRRPG